MTGAQIRAARALLNWSREDLARQCNLSSRTIARFEDNDGIARNRTLSAFVTALKTAGVVFEGGGVRLTQERRQEGS